MKWFAQGSDVKSSCLSLCFSFSPSCTYSLILIVIDDYFLFAQYSFVFLSLSSLVLPYHHLSVCLPPVLLHVLGLGAEVAQAGEVRGPKKVASAAAGQARVQWVLGESGGNSVLFPASLLARSLGSNTWVQGGEAQSSRVGWPHYYTIYFQTDPLSLVFFCGSWHSFRRREQCYFLAIPPSWVLFF